MNSVINKQYNYALIGASKDEGKYGYKILKNLLEAGFNVMPINPKGGRILDQDVYKSIEDVSSNIDVAIFVVPSSIGESVIESVVKKRISKVWLQPGSESDFLIKFCKENEIECYHSACIMVEQLKHLS